MKPTTEEISNSIQVSWDYLVSSSPSKRKCYVAFVLGREDFHIPEKVIELYHQHNLTHIILLGGRGRLTGSIATSESQAFKEYLLSRNIPEEVMYLDESSTNTGENIVEGLKILQSVAPK